MKKLRVTFISGEDGYTEVSGGNKYDKWDFKVNPIAEFILMDRKTLNNKAPATGTFDLYTVIEKISKKPYAFFCGKVLEDKLKNIPLYSLVKIVFEGAHPTKRYHIYKVYQNANFRFDPAQFSLDNYAEVKSEEQPKSNQSIGSTQNKIPAQQIEEDLPF